MKRSFGISFLVTLIILSVIHPAFAQNIRWAKKAGGTTNFDYGRAIATDNSGNCYITGVFGGEANFDRVTLVSNNQRDIFVAKYHPDGSLAWAKQSKGNILYGSFGIAVDRTGNSYVTGEIRLTTEFDGITLQGDQDGDVFVAKYDPDGSVVWAKKAGGLGHDIGRGIAVDNSGNTYVTGRFRGNADFDNFSLNAVDDADIFIAKYNSDGSVVWAKQAGGTSFDEGWDISVDNSGNCYVVGAFGRVATFDNTTLTSAGVADIFLAKYSNNGSLVWVKQLGGLPEYMDGPSISVDISGNCYVTGKFSGEDTFEGITLTSHGGNDIFVAKYNNEGSMAWVKQAGGPSYDKGSGISVDGSGNCYVTGTIQEGAIFDGVTFTSGGSFIAKYNSNGSLTWVKQNSGEGSDITLDNSGNCYVTGFFTGEAIFDGVTLSSAGGSDIFVTKYGVEKMCWPPHRGVPYDPDPPTIDGTVQEDVGWRGAQRNTYGDGTDNPHVAMQTLHHRTNDYLYISFEIRNDVSFDNDDAIVLCFRPDAYNIIPENDIRILVYPLCDNDGAAGPGCIMATPVVKLNQAPRILEVWKNSNGWTQMANLPTNFEVKVSSFPDGNSFAWNVEIQVPTSESAGGTQWVNFADDFLFYSNVIRISNPGGFASEFRWPRTAPEIGGQISNYPFNPEEWDYGTKSSLAKCNGISISSIDVGTYNIPSSYIKVNSVPNTFSNKFFATVSNNTEVSGSACQANDVNVRFRIANWGLPGPRDWEDVAASNLGCPDATLLSNPTCPENIPAAVGGIAGRKEFNLYWTVPDIDVPEYLANKHQCILVEINSLSDANIVTKSVCRNMDFGTASKFVRAAEISSRGYGLAPKGFVNQEFHLQVFTNEYEFRRKTTFDTLKLKTLINKKQFDEKKPISVLNYNVNGYRNTGKFIIINDHKYYIIDPVGSFGYILSHNRKVKEWKHFIAGCELIQPNHYKLNIPCEGKVSVVSEIKPIEYLNKWSLSFHSGLAIPVESFANDFGKGINFLLDADYHFSTQLSAIALFGYNDFKSKNPGISDNYWLNFSANLRYNKTIKGLWSIYLGGGPGLYIPEKGKNQWGVNLGLGFDYEYSSSINFEFGVENHLLFDQKIQFLHFHTGIIFRF